MLENNKTDIPDLLERVRELQKWIDELTDKLMDKCRDHLKQCERAEAAEATVQRQTDELKQWETCGVVEIAVRNPNVSSYVEHWEGRATKAEATVREQAGALAQIAKLAKLCSEHGLLDAEREAFRKIYRMAAPSGTSTSGYVQEVTSDLEGPSCHVCGAIMVKVQDGIRKDPFWKCLSCGTTTAPAPSGTGTKEGE